MEDDKQKKKEELQVAQREAVIALVDDVRTLVLGLMKEGERAAVVVGAARLDLALEHVLKQVMRPHPGGQDDLFDPDRPLGSFSSKISLAYRLGLLDEKVESALHLVRRIRNAFAHSVGVASLSEASHSSRLRELTERCRQDDLYVTIRDVLIAQKSLSKELGLFCTALVVLIVDIEFAAMDAKPLDMKSPATFR